MTLPLGPMTSPTLSIGMWIVVIFGAVGGDLVARRGDGRVHHLEDLQAGHLGLVERGGQHVGGDAVDLRVELQGGDRVGGAGDLEVHVAERVLGTEDVGERRVLAVGVDEAHGDAGDRRLDRHAGVHQRQAGRRTPTPSRSSRWSSAPRRRGAACRRTPPGSARPAGSPGRRGRRGRSRGASANRRGRSRRWPTAACCSGAGSASCVSGLSVSSSWFMRGMASVHTFEHLGLAALEQAGAVRRRQHADLGRHRAQVGDAAAVDAQALVDDALADELLGQASGRPP